MSRIGNKPIALTGGVSADVSGRNVTVKGPKATLQQELPELVEAKVEENQLVVTRTNESRRAKAMHGLARSLLNNMVVGVATGFKKELEIRGVGYRAEVKGKNLVLSVGYSHPVEHPIPDGIEITVGKNNVITVSGADKQQVGQVAADIREYRPPDVYKGKGIRYVGEYVIQKEGKTV